MDFRRETVGGLAARIRARSVSAREVVGHALDRIEQLNGAINAFVAVDGEAALAAAADIDERLARGEEVGDLAGIPIGVKDLEDTVGYKTTKGSRLFADDPEAEHDSILVSRLKAVGCIVVGKTNTPELGYKADTANPLYGATLNPWDRRHSPGGSSGGSAAAVAAGMVPLATGSDGGGSLRIPSSLCGLSGFKPSLGRVPSGGPHAPDWHHLSTRGPMARTISELALVLDEVIGPDPSDLRSLPMPEPSWLGALEDPHVPASVVWSPTLGYAEVDREVLNICERAVGVFADLGSNVETVDTVFERDPGGAWMTMASIYNLRTLQPFEGTPQWEEIDPDLRAQIEYARSFSAVDLVKAEDTCHELNIDLVRLFHRCRLLITPTVAAAPPVSRSPGVVNGKPDPNWVRFTYPFNMTRSPAATVNAGFTTTGLPVGLQLIGPQHADLVVLRAAAALEAALDLDAVAPIDV
ncbi:MAG TPA: amidase family protein [Acidimicrobiales bacterium]|nr:amidase family protein [Acidimicrobiales bacterium]